MQPLEPEPYPSPPFPEHAELDITIVGNENLSPEKIQTYELGYQTILNKKARLTADIFYNKINDFIGTGEFSPVSFLREPVTGALIRDPQTGNPVPSTLTQSFVNLGSAEATGAELDVDLLARSWLQLRANYTFLYFQNRYTLNEFQKPPKNKFNVFMDISPGSDISLNVLGHYADVMYWDIDTDNNSIPEKHITPSYFTVDSRISYKIPRSRYQLIGVIHNLFNNRHKEYPVGETIGRRFNVRLQIKL
jgi:outer membrane receptor protein involved in Fe transport